MLNSSLGIKNQIIFIKSKYNNKTLQKKPNIWFKKYYHSDSHSKHKVINKNCFP
jgi:hypothetical protein